jgi:hypothetical protein
MRTHPMPMAALVVCLASGAANAGDLTLKRVMLSTGGVGYFEYATTADGPVTLGLDVPLARVDDVLQSLVVFDSAGGVGGVELPGAEASHAAFADVPFGEQALASALAFLNALRGVEFEVTGPRPMRGRLLRAERVREPAAGPPETGVPRTRVTLLTDGGLRQFVLEEADSVQVADAGLRDRIARMLDSLRGQAASDARHLRLRDGGAGQREIRVGYVAGAPLWKTTYRLVLPQAGGATARLQGWAVLENQSGADWNGVALALQYGNPVTFRQALYQSYYVDRPEVPVEVLGRMLPGVDTGALAATDLPNVRFGPMKASPRAAPAPMAAALPAPAASRQMAEPEQRAAASEAVDSTVFRLAAPLVLPAGHSATVPILDREVPAERVGVVRQGRTHPAQAIQIVNDGATSLPAGVLTLYDPTDAATFAGDARLGGLPAGERRLLEFAEDLRTKVDWRQEETSALLDVTAAQGVLHVRDRDRWTARVTLVAPAKEPRKLLLEIPRRGGGELVVEDGPAPSGETATAWRLPLDLRAGETRVVVAHVDRINLETTEISADNRVLARLLGEQALTPAARAALQHVVDLRAELAARESERDAAKARLADVERDEDRIRRNLSAVPASDALHGKLVRGLDADEDRVAAETSAIAQAEQAVAAARTALEQAARSLQI